MREFQGAVLFVDILGIGALTTSKVQIVGPQDFEALSWSTNLAASNQTFCAVLLSKFRRNLMKVERKEIKIAQLSDCAFIWSEDLDELLEVTRQLFWLNTYSGVLTRGGMTFGQIVEPDSTASRIGQFVCGEAVTRAVELEGKGKGSRVFVDTVLPGKPLRRFPPSTFTDLINASDFGRIDEFCWFALPELNGQGSKMSISQIGKIADLSLLMQYSPMFRWNAGSPAGQLQLAATIERVGIELGKILELHDLKEPPGVMKSVPTYLAGNPADADVRSNKQLATFRQLVGKWLEQSGGTRNAK